MSILKATHIGELVIGDIVLPCAVLPDGTRLMAQGAMAYRFWSSNGWLADAQTRSERAQG